MRSYPALSFSRACIRDPVSTIATSPSHFRSISASKRGDSPTAPGSRLLEQLGERALDGALERAGLTRHDLDACSSFQ